MHKNPLKKGYRGYKEFLKIQLMDSPYKKGDFVELT
jgi:hypothetical protein